ncbi:MAG: rod shape-determining protein MreC [Planctomycetota bacterium]|jgi:rod shape-determining protein MreC
MDNLIKFISKYSLLFLFIFLQLIAIFLIVQNNRYHKASFINSANYFTGSVYSNVKNATMYMDLKQENEKLAQENAILRNSLQSIEYTLIPPLDSIVLDTTITGETILDTLILDSLNYFKYIPALVISNTINKRYNYVYLDKGTRHGMYNNMGIIEPNGLVGVVVNVTEDFSLVMPLINEKSKISVKIKNQGYFGTLQWEKGDARFAHINEVPNHVILEKGDTIVSSGYSQIFPKNILIGYVEETNKESGNSFLNIKIRLSVDFSKLNYTYAINNKQIESFKKLEIE